MLGETIERIAQVEELRTGGATVEKACREVGIGIGTYYAGRSEASSVRKKQRKAVKSTKLRKFIDLPVEVTPSQVTVIRCGLTDLTYVLGLLK